jgi:poly [ADP-ribose] polymerase
LECLIKINHLANYCFTTKQSPEGLMLLYEVALGNIYECYKATNLSVSILQSGTSSTKGCGSTMPNLKGFINFSKYKFNFSFC